MTAIQGHTAGGFEAVADAFGANFTEHGEVGGAFAAYHRGELVVDIWGGMADPGSGRPWQPDTLQLLFSGTKGLTAACVLLLVERGQLDLDTPASRYWPEFAAEGKAGITVGEIMSHQARLPGIREPFDQHTILDPAHMAQLLAAQAPDPDPRAAFMYHALTYGWLADALVRKVDGRSIGQLFHEEFARPLELDVWIGLPEEHHHRVSTTIAAPNVLIGPREPACGDDPLLHLIRNPLVFTDAPATWNSRAFRTAELSAVGAHGTARSMAKFYACLAQGGEIDGVRVLARKTLEIGRKERRRGTEPLWNSPIAYATGFELQTELSMFGPAPDAFGHAGFGGSRHAAWPAHEVGFSYAMNETRAQVPDPRPQSLLTALHKAVLAQQQPCPG